MPTFNTTLFFDCRRSVGVLMQVAWGHLHASAVGGLKQFEHLCDLWPLALGLIAKPLIGGSPPGQLPLPELARQLAQKDC